MKNLLLLTFLLALLLTLGPRPIAFSQSPSSSETAATQAAENLKTRLKQTLSEETTPEPSSLPKGYVGTVRDIVKNTLVFEDKEGRKNLLITDNSLILRSPGNSEIDLASVRLEDSIIAMGYPIENGEIDGRRIIVSTLPFSPPPKTSGLGTITELSRTKLTLSLPDSPTPLSLNLSTKTLYKTPLEILSFEDLQVGDMILYTATVADNQEFSTSVIMLIKPAPSPSASPTN